MSEPQNRVLLSLTIEQAQAVREALETHSRLGIGQIEYVEELVRLGTVPIKDEPQAFEQRQGIWDGFRDLMMAGKRVLGFSQGSSYGIGNDKVHPSVHRAWEVQKVLDRALSLHRNPDPQFRGVNYDGLLVRYTQDPEPFVAVVAADASQELVAQLGLVEQNRNIKPRP